MENRLALHEKLVEILGSENVYFQPPESLKLKYPAIIYSRNRIDNSFADDSVYQQNHGYMVMVVDKDPDSLIVDRLSKFPMTSFDRHYVADNLNHDVFTVYYR